MSAYSELVKNFEKIRSYMREFYVYGFKSREEYNKKSARSYDDERRRIESWLSEYMHFVRTPQGKNVFISIDSRTTRHNPFYKALKSKSFTDGDITLHFLLFDLLYSPEVSMSLQQITAEIDSLLSAFSKPMIFDESTVRKKLKEYIALGIITAKSEGKRILYSRTEDIVLPDITALLGFYSEVLPCGVIGSFLLDKGAQTSSPFTFKHHYITSALDSNVTALLFTAMRLKSAVTVKNLSRKSDKPQDNRIIPLRVFVSAQTGRQHLMAYQPSLNIIKSFRVDYLSDVRIEEPSPRFDELRQELDKMQNKMWGVATKYRLGKEGECEKVEFTVKIGKGEEYIIRRLRREKRIGKIEQVTSDTYRFSAEVYDSTELLPWIRTFICRLTELRFSNRTVENVFKQDLKEMYKLYGIEEDEQ